MATANQITRIVANHTETDFDRVDAIARQLIAAEAWPASARADLEPRQIVLLLLALMAEAKPESATSVARHYSDLQLTGDDKDNGTATTAGQMVEQMLTTFLDRALTGFSRWAYRSRIEVCTTSPAIRIITPCIDVPMYLDYLEHSADAWHETPVRRHNVLAGQILLYIADDINSFPPMEGMTVPFQVTKIDGQNV